MSDLFVPLVTPPEASTAPAHWFLFQGSQLLVQREEGRARVPLVADAHALGLEPVRTQYLGTLAGRHCYSGECGPDMVAPAGYSWSGLRALFGLFDDAVFALAGRAVQIVDWDRSHQYCGRCGTPTVLKAGERARQCPECQQIHYPRIAPAVMALVRRQNRLLLARSPHFAPGMYSALAGFVEPGESLEHCLVREVAEEVGVKVANLRYFSSQPWPFPHSLMIAFNCDWVEGEITPDPAEIEAAGWFGLEDLPLLPNKISIARRLIDSMLTAMRAGAPVS